jgi:hypothetical protein
MGLLRQPVHAILDDEELLVRLCGDDIQAFRHTEPLITGMGVHRVPVSTHVEMDYSSAD